MSKNDELNWSADLRRIAWWLQIGNAKLAKKFIDRGKEMYVSDKKICGNEWSWWMNQISQTDNLKAAERALTWSLILRR